MSSGLQASGTQPLLRSHVTKSSPEGAQAWLYAACRQECAGENAVLHTLL
jgi:hypothetical protein